MRNKRSGMVWLLLAAVLVMALGSCKPSIPDGIIKPGKMEDILYDMHLARAIANSQMGNSAERDVDYTALQLSVLKKYDVTQKEFDESLYYYMRHTERMHEIYENLAERLTSESEALGSTESDLSSIGAAAQGDTANVWRGDKAFVLSPYVPFNKVSFALAADTAYHKGDAIMMSFDTQFIVQEGMRDAMAVLAVRFGNDSVYAYTTHISGDTRNTLRIDDNRNLGIKEVKGLILVGPANNDMNAATTLRLLCVSNMQIVRMHHKEMPAPAAPGTEGDSMPGQQRQSHPPIMLGKP